MRQSVADENVADGQMSQDLAAAICDCLHSFWTDQGIPEKKAASNARSALRVLWRRRDVEGTWVLLPPA